MNWRHPESRHHQPDWETNEWLQTETNELETYVEPDTPSHTGRQMNCYKGRQMNCYKGKQINWTHPESWTPPARLGDKWIAIREDKSIGDIRRAGRHQPDWETNESFYGETNELETSREPDTTSQTGRQMNRYIGRQMNWRQPESRKPPARLGDKLIAMRGNKWIGDIRRAGRHQPDWETNESFYGETNELETSRAPDTTSQTGRQMDCYKGRQMESRTPPARLGDKWNCYKGKQMNWRHAERRTP